MKRSIFEEGFKEIVTKVKSLFNKAARAEAKELRKVNNDIEESKRVFTLTLHECNKRSQCVTLYDELLVVVERYKELVENDPMESRAKLVKDYCDWIEKFLKEVDSKIKTLQESSELDDVEIDFIEEGFKDIINKFKGMKDLHDIKKLNKKFKKQVLKDIDSITDPEDAKKMRTNILNFIERDASFENQGTPQDKEMDNYINWLKDTALPLLDKKMVCEGYVFDGEEYIEEGLFKKRTEVEIEIIYDDWEAHCSAYAVGDDVHCLKSVTIDLPEEFHSGSDKSNPKGNWEEALIKVAKKLTKKDFKEFKIKRWFVH